MEKVGFVYLESEGVNRFVGIERIDNEGIWEFYIIMGVEEVIKKRYFIILKVEC